MSQATLFDLVEPNQTRFQRLGDIAEIIPGRGIPKTSFAETGVPAVHYGQIPGLAPMFDIAPIGTVDTGKLVFAEYGDVVVTQRGFDLSKIWAASVWLGDKPVAVSDAAVIVRTGAWIPLFAGWVFQAPSIREQVKARVTGERPMGLTMPVLNSLVVPVPPLELQRERAEALETLRAMRSTGPGLLEEQLSAQGGVVRSRLWGLLKEAANA